MSERPAFDYGVAASALESLGDAIRYRRGLLGFSLRNVGRQSGVSFNVVTRVEHGNGCAARSAVALMRWLDDTAITSGCTRAPEGWWCLRAAGHNGPCHVSEVTW